MIAEGRPVTRPLLCVPSSKQSARTGTGGAGSDDSSADCERDCAAAESQPRLGQTKAVEKRRLPLRIDWRSAHFPKGLKIGFLLKAFGPFLHLKGVPIHGKPKKISRQRSSHSGFDCGSDVWRNRQHEQMRERQEDSVQQLELPHCKPKPGLSGLPAGLSRTRD